MGGPVPYLVAALLAGVTLACGGGSASNSSPRETPRSEPAPAESRAAPAPDDRPVVLAFGDSLSAGHGVDPGLSYPDFLQKEIDADGYRYRVVNQGISGDTTSGGVERIENGLSVKPEVVIVELGGNDGLRGLPLSITGKNLDEIVSRFQQAGVKVILAGITLPPNYGPDYIRDFEAIYKNLAVTHNAPLIPFLLEGVASNPALMQRDGIHPTAEGNRRVSALVWKTLRPLLKARLRRTRSAASDQRSAHDLSFYLSGAEG